MREALAKMVSEMHEWVRGQNRAHFGLDAEQQENGTYLVTDAATHEPLAQVTSVLALIAVVKLLRRTP